MLGRRNGIDKVVLHLAADLILPGPAFSGSICVGLCLRLLKRPGSCKAYLLALSLLTRFALKEQPANPCLLALHASQEGGNEGQGSYAPDHRLGPSLSFVPAW